MAAIFWALGTTVASANLPNGLVATYAYDDASQLTGITHTAGATTVGDLAYSYTAAGHRAGVSGSLVRSTLPAAVASSTYDAANRLTSWDGGAASPTWDLDGNLTADGTFGYSWNARGELTTIHAGVTTVAAYAYDAFGRRTQKTLAGITTGFAYAGATAVQEQDGTGSPTAELLAGGIDRTLVRTEAAGTRYPLTDALGSVVALTDATGAITTRYAYDPFGATTAIGATSTNASQFTGRENDGALYYYRARFYSPTLGRFISEDPAGFGAGDPNVYAYVGNDPTDARDPSGRCGPVCAAVVASCGFGSVMGATETFLHAFTGDRLSGRKTRWGDVVQSAIEGCALFAVAHGAANLIDWLAAGGADSGGTYLYRGVAQDHPGFGSALRGIAEPRGGTASAVEHNLGDTMSPFTSWTTNPDIAASFAGENGVVLRIPYGSGSGYGIVQSPDLWGESEVLIEGTVSGAEVLR